jgi:hypothetical protein
VRLALGCILFREGIGGLLMARILESEHRGGSGTAVMPKEAPPCTDLREAAPSPCRWPTLAITDLTMRDVDAALAAEPLFHRCPDGHQGRVEVRYWYLRPMNFSCCHCSQGGGVCVVDPATVLCRHRVAPRAGAPPLGR